MQSFIIDEYGMVYWEVGENKVVNEYGLSRILLKDDEWDYMMRSRGHIIASLKTSY